MSIHIPGTSTPDEPIEDFSGSECSSSSSDGEEETWDDWVSDSAKQPCQSLFDEESFPSAQEALAHDKSTHSFDLDAACSKLALDNYGRIRLINYIRKEKIPPAKVAELSGSEEWLKADEYLIPVVENDPLLQLETDDWSDEEEQNPSDPAQRIRALEKKLARAHQEFEDYRELIAQKIDIGSFSDRATAGPSEPKPRDDDTHYFESYGANDIHAVMIQDKVRTSTYAQFLLTNPALLDDAVVLDVGCGTGILSLFAARGGARKVYAVDASNIGDKAKEIIKANGMEDTITVLRGKIEDIEIPEKVDLIVSEWMGYALLYESMLDSVLNARDRFLKPGGVVAPSQLHMVLGLCDASEIVKERLTFWNDVYGFDMTTMAKEVYNEAVIDVVGPHTVLSTPFVVKDLLIGEIITKQLNFHSTFQLTTTVERKTRVTAFVLYFDTFFSPSGRPIPPNTQVKVVKENEVVLAEVWPVGGKPAPQRRASHGGKPERITSFSTGPQSIPTHWKQALFLLREPFVVDEGQEVKGTFYCRKSESNSRELMVEIHYAPPGSEDMTVQMFTVE
ncbi:arginine N-methyltransferase 3 [Cylindrobasidium torrendii FP15055 ss-10]|uniref:type I protein arginine methyltransferase n=1 Tax=Cylindrobasidium torrendii FP15055 ss-10 TaxID=1314674 RepID=A0A0D7AS35_9AGAR|nr:arginine N-methyltransferase 3 [Cylindrobasidium torrendii FP15055 ss-10]